MAALDSASSSSSVASTVGSSSYDVFLSFRGEDTRNNFIWFLHKALKDAGIDVFLDNENLWTGEAIGPTLLKAIEGSKISIPVFSKGYADSKWCLQELAQIFQCYKSNGQIVLPIFFHVDPSQVRNQIGSFEEAFREHEKIFEADIVKSWREALREVGNLKGEVLKETMNPAELVDSIVKRTLSELVSSTHLAECEYRIDMGSRINDLLSLLNIGSNDALFVGICGFGGIGKTTIAKAVYNRIFPTFDRHSFLSDVREQATQCKGLVSLQKQLLKDIFKSDYDIEDLHRGKKLIEERVCKKKVFLVLDDVDSKDQIGALAGGLNWFGQGSRVIITTRDENILNIAKVSTYKIYRPPFLDHENSLQLFSWHAFQSKQPPEEYMQLSRDVAIHSGGLPLTLEVFGSYLSDHSDKETWESTLQTLKEIPPVEVQRRLKISYDNLENDNQKAIFLDAACFFIGREKESLISIWEGCGYHPKSALCKLIKRSLLKFVDGWNGEYLAMHDHIRDMGREIVSEESRKEPGKRSRLWSNGKIMEVLEEHKGTNMIEGMSLHYLSETLIEFTDEPFKMMPNIRFLDISSANFVGDLSQFPSALRCLEWKDIPTDTLPTNFYHKRLVYLNLSDSYIEHAWNIRPQDENQGFQNLKVLNLGGCAYLSKSPDFSWFPYLEKLDLRDCTSLDGLDESIRQLSQLKSLILNSCCSFKKLPESIGDLKSLVKLDLKKTKIEELPDSISRMSSLKELILYSCHSFKKLPESIGDLKSLVKLDLTETKIEELPDSISRMSSLKELILFWCLSLYKLPKSIGDIKSLVKLELRDTKIQELPYSISRMSSLKELILGSHRSSKKLPKSIGDLKSLVKLELTNKEIEELPDSISRMSSLKELILNSCHSFKKLPESIGDLKSLVKLGLRGTQIEELPDSISRMSSLKELILISCRSFKKLLESIGDLKSLVKLELSDTKIEELPDSISRMSSLKELILYLCRSFKKFPESIGDLKSLVKLELVNSQVEELPDSISRMSSLKELILLYCESLKKLGDGVGVLEKLEKLDLRGCTEVVKLPRSMGGMRCLHSINLNKIKITKFPNDFSMPPNLVKLEINSLRRLESFQVDMSPLKTLQELEIHECEKLEYLPELPSSLVELRCKNCVSLVRLPDLSKLKNLTTVKLMYCKKLEEIPGLEGIESLEEMDVRGSYNLTHTPKKIQGTLLPFNRSLELSYNYSLTVSDGIYNNGLILCLVLEAGGYFQGIIIDISACIHKTDKEISCFHSLRIKDIEYATERDIIYIHHFKGFDWFGIPLQEKDAIEILDISTYNSATVKFCKVLFKNGEPDQKIPNWSASMVADLFNWPYVYDDGGVVTLNYWPHLQDFLSCMGFDPVSEVVGNKEEIQSLRDNDDEASGPPSLSLSLTCWPQEEVEGSNSIPKEKEEKEEVLTRATSNYKDEEASSCSCLLTLALTTSSSPPPPQPPPPCVVLASPSDNDNTEEEMERNIIFHTVDFLSCLDSDSHVMVEDGEMLRPSKRPRLLDLNDDEATGPSYPGFE